MGWDDSGELPGEDERADVAVGFDALEGAQDDAGDDTDPSGVSQDEGEALDPDEVVLEDAPLPEFVERLMGAGLVSDDLTVAEVTATLGPVYDLDELATSQVEDIVDRLEGVGVQWAIDRAAERRRKSEAT